MRSFGVLVMLFGGKVVSRISCRSMFLCVLYFMVDMRWFRFVNGSIWSGVRIFMLFVVVMRERSLRIRSMIIVCLVRFLSLLFSCVVLVVLSELLWVMVFLIGFVYRCWFWWFYCRKCFMVWFSIV